MSNVVQKGAEAVKDKVSGNILNMVQCNYV